MDYVKELTNLVAEGAPYVSAFAHNLEEPLLVLLLGTAIRDACRVSSTVAVDEAVVATASVDRKLCQQVHTVLYFSLVLCVK